MRVTKKLICDGLSKSLIEFGYPDASPEFMAEIYDAYRAGKRFPDLPHAVLGGFAEKQLDDLVEHIGALPAA